MGFEISDPIWDLDHLQPNLFSTINIQTSPDFRSSLYIAVGIWTPDFKPVIFDTLHKVYKNVKAPENLIKSVIQTKAWIQWGSVKQTKVWYLNGQK